MANIGDSMLEKREKVVIWLNTFEFMSHKKIYEIIQSKIDLVDMFDNIDSYRELLLKIVSLEEFAQLSKSRNMAKIDRLIDNYNSLNINVITIVSQDYPQLLREIDSPPNILYYRGDIALINGNCLGVVGTRRATKYGRDMCSRFVRDIASEGIVIVSGLADGIDTVAHKSTLEVKGKTIAVLGGGLLNLYPASNIKLAGEIVDNGGLLLTEYKPGEMALTYHFPVRNRIIAGLSQAVFIVEATEKSGSMHTKNYAIDYNRDVFALPGRIGDIYSSGCNKCIQNGQARMVLDSSDITSFFGKNSGDRHENNAIQLTLEENMIYDALIGEEKHFDELIKIVGMDAKTLQTWLMRMMLKGVVDKLPNNYYALIIRS